MVQVDVFWSYALGAKLAVSASEQLADEARRGTDPVASGYFARTLLFIATIFAPSGVCLLWAFPSWETMHVGARDMPAWIVTAFALTNITQAVFGYFVTRMLITRGRRYGAYLQFVAGYFAMFFILVHGWDGTGYQRFFSATRAEFLHWRGSGQVWDFFGTDVALTLYGMGVILVPTLLVMCGRWLRAGHQARRPGGPTPALATLAGRVLLGVFGLGLGSAVAASLLIHALGWLAGAAAFFAGAYLLVLRRGAIAWRLFRATVPS